jgi:PleD family two-component response regulator
MPKVLLLQFDTDPARADRRTILQSTGMRVVESEPRWPTFFDVVTAQRPDIIVIAASTIPSHAFEAARYLGDGFNTRNIPVLLVDVDPKDRARAQAPAPQAKIIERSALADAVKEALQPKASTDSG